VLLTLHDMKQFEVRGYSPDWRPKSREKAVALGLAEERSGSFFLTEAGRAALGETGAGGVT
jgi:hypothetical protein